MKIAVCLSGLTRQHERSLESIKRELPNADVFAHSYEIKDIHKIINDSWSKDSTKEYYENLVLNTEDIILQFNPKTYQIDDYATVSKFFDFLYSLIGFEESEKNLSVISMFYSIHASNQLRINYEKAHNITYDLVIRMRYDINLNNFEPSEYKNASLYIPASHDKMLTSYDCLIDQFAFGPPDIMNTYSNLFDHIVPVARESGRLFPEKMLMTYFKTKDINIERPFIKMSINKSRKWLDKATDYDSDHIGYTINDLPTSTNNLKHIDEALFHEHDSVFIIENDEDPSELTIALVSGSTFWPNIPECCKPSQKGYVTLDTSTEKWAILECNARNQKYLQYLMDYTQVLAHESSAEL